jgi:8-oxo-dGTP diphosphatase
MELFVAAKALIVRDGRILLLRQSPDYADSVRAKDGKWDVPGGRIEPEEEVLAGLAREVKEESGLDVSPVRLAGIRDGFPEIRGEICHVVRIYFLCDDTEGDVILSGDHDAYNWTDPEDIGGKTPLDDIKEMFEALKNPLNT